MRIRLKEIRRWLLSDERYLKATFSKHLGYPLNLDDPQTLNEKLQWLKLYYQPQLLTQCADKAGVNQYVAAEIGEKYLIPLHGTVSDPNQLKVDMLPDEPFILKANHTSGTYLIVRDKSTLNEKQLQQTCRQWLKYDHYRETKEYQYKNISPCILIQKLLTAPSGKIPEDYRFTCINGKVEMIHIDDKLDGERYRNTYDSDWNELSFQWAFGPMKKATPAPKPTQLETMIALAETLAKPFPYVRVDFYVIAEQIFFGELTFHPMSGYGKFEPAELDLYYGNLLKLPKPVMLSPK